MSFRRGSDSSDDNVDVEAGVTRTNSGCFACFKKYACADPAFFVTSAVDAADSVFDVLQGLVLINLQTTMEELGAQCPDSGSTDGLKTDGTPCYQTELWGLILIVTACLSFILARKAGISVMLMKKQGADTEYYRAVMASLAAFLAEAAVLALAMQEYSEARRGLNAVSPDLGSLTSANETEAVALNPFDPFNFTMLNAWLSVLSGTLISVRMLHIACTRNVALDTSEKATASSNRNMLILSSVLNLAMAFVVCLTIMQAALGEETTMPPWTLYTVAVLNGIGVVFGNLQWVTWYEDAGVWTQVTCCPQDCVYACDCCCLLCAECTADDKGMTAEQKRKAAQARNECTICEQAQPYTGGGICFCEYCCWRPKELNVDGQLIAYEATHANTSKDGKHFSKLCLCTCDILRDMPDSYRV